MAKSIQSMIAIDCGASFTKAVLLTQSDSRFRWQAEAVTLSTPRAPWMDVALGADDALVMLAEQTGKTFLSPDGGDIIGADAVTIVTTAGDPLRVMLAGTTAGGSLQAARRAIATAFAMPVAEFALDDPPEARLAEARIAKIHQTPADVLLMVGGIDGGIAEPVLDLAQVMAMALQTMPAARRPAVIFAGNKQLRAQMASIFGRITDFKSVDNVLPAPGIEMPDGVRAELEILHQQKKYADIPGGDTLRRWSGAPVLPTATSFAHTVHFLGQTYRINVLGVQVGSRTITLAAVNDGVPRTFIAPNAGIAGERTPAQVATLATDAARWLPFEMPTEQLRTIVYNRAIYPHTIPANSKEMMIEAAVLRACLQQTRARMMSARETSLPVDVIVAAGQSLTGMADKNLLALTLLDGLQPAGIFTIALEKHHLLGMLGAIAAVDPRVATDVAAFDALEKLTTVVVPTGDGYAGDVALKIKFTPAEGEPARTETIRFGELCHLPDTAGKQLELVLQPGRRFSLAADGSSPGKRLTVVVDGGSLGVIVDARGRPPETARKDAARIAQLRQWLSAVDADFETEAQSNETANPAD